MAGRPTVKEMCAKYWESCSGVNIGEAQNGIAIVFNQVNRCRFLRDDFCRSWPSPGVTTWYLILSRLLTCDLFSNVSRLWC